MKKLISLALVLLMTLGCMGTAFAAEVSSEGLTVNGWNGWTVKSGTAVTTLKSANLQTAKLKQYFLKILKIAR